MVSMVPNTDPSTKDSMVAYVAFSRCNMAAAPVLAGEGSAALALSVLGSSAVTMKTSLPSSTVGVANLSALIPPLSMSAS